MSRERHQIDTHILHIDRNLADTLRRIAVKEDALFLGDLADLFDGVDRADFIVRQHDGDEDRLVGNGFPHILGIHHSEFIDREIGGCRFALAL